MIHLYSDSRCPFSHRVRLVLFIKDMDFKIIDVTIHLRQDLLLVNPNNETPVLVDDIDKNDKNRDLVLSETTIICEYIDERFPHPQLMPVEPAEKARLRMLIHRLDTELFTYLRGLENAFNKDSKAKKDIERYKSKVIEGLDSIANVFIANKKAKHFVGENFTLVDAALLPLLWRLEYYEIEARPSWAYMLNYAENLFQMPAFMASLTPAEKGMRPSAS